MQEQKHHNDNTTPKFTLSNDNTCIGLEKFISWENGVLVCSYHNTDTGQQIDRYWYEEKQNVDKLSVCPLTRKKFKYALVWEIPKDIQRLIKGEDSTTLTTEHKTLCRALDDKHNEIAWERPTPSSAAVDHRFNELIITGEAQGLRGLSRDELVLLVLKHNFLRADYKLRLKLIKLTLLNTGLFLFEFLWNIIVLTINAILGIAILLAGLFTLDPKTFFSGIGLGALIACATSYTVVQQTSIILYMAMYSLSLPFSCLNAVLTCASNYIHKKIREKNAEGFDRIDINTSLLSEDDITEIVKDYRSQFRKRHPTFISLCSLGLFSAQQSKSSAELAQTLQGTSSSLEEKRSMIATYLGQRENRGKSLWKSIVTHAQEHRRTIVRSASAAPVAPPLGNMDFSPARRF